VANSPATILDVSRHLRQLYSAWEAVLYPNGRLSQPARLKTQIGEGATGYRKDAHEIVLFLAEDNLSDYDNRLGVIELKPSWATRPVAETELLHEMLHEMQFTERTTATSEGQALLSRQKWLSADDHHDAVWYSVIAYAAPLLGLTDDELVKQL
jgi:hypothetical protein